MQRTTLQAAKEDTKPAKLGDLKRRLMCMGDHFAVRKARLWKFLVKNRLRRKMAKQLLTTMRAHSKIYGLIVAQVQYAKKLSRTAGYRNKTGDSAVVPILS